jgi:Putative peptidoglycan binding domain
MNTPLTDLLKAIAHKTLENSSLPRERSTLSVMHCLLCIGLGLTTLGIAYPAWSLQWGDSGDETADLQSRLAALEYFSTPVTGFYGEITENAVMKFQEDNQLLVDGD